MSDNNPWNQLPHDTYEKHMGHENVRQLETLSRILGEQLSLAAGISKPAVAILGITGGNGLDNIEAGKYKTIIGIDINEEYLNICRERYSHLPELELHRIDLMTEKERAADILKQCDLLTANLVVKHIHLDNFIDIVRRLEKPIVSVTIQYNPDGQSLSQSGYETAFDDIQTQGKDCDEQILDTAMRGAEYMQTGRAEYELPNKKVFIRLDYKRQSVTIRLAVQADAPDMAEVHMRSWEAAYKDIIPEKYIREKNAGRPAMWGKILAGVNTAQYIIKKDGKTAGMMGIGASRDDDAGEETYELMGLYLLPEYFRQGIGKQAMEFAFTQARCLEMKFMTVWLLEDNLNAKRFYEKCGFIADGSLRKQNFGKLLNTIRMRRDL